MKKTKLSELIHKKYIYYIYLEHCWYQLRLKEFPTDTKNILNCLDTQIVENLILRPILNITKIRTDNRIEFVGGPKSARKDYGFSRFWRHETRDRPSPNWNRRTY